METITELLKDLFNIWLEIIKTIWAYIPKAMILFLWIISGIIILPCVYVASTFYPKWTDWGEKL